MKTRLPLVIGVLLFLAVLAVGVNGFSRRSASHEDRMTSLYEKAIMVSAERAFMLGQLYELRRSQGLDVSTNTMSVVTNAIYHHFHDDK